MTKKQAVKAWIKWKIHWWRFKRERRHLEFILYVMGPHPKWCQIKHENEIFGIWKRF